MNLPRPNRGFIKKNLFVQFLFFHLIIDDLVYFWAISRKSPNFCFIFKDVLSIFSLSIVFGWGKWTRWCFRVKKLCRLISEKSKLFGEFLIFHIKTYFVVSTRTRIFPRNPRQGKSGKRSKTVSPSSHRRCSKQVTNSVINWCFDVPFSHHQSHFSSQNRRNFA